MCEYCEKRISNKKILDIDNETETHMEIINQKKSWGYMLYVEIEGQDNDGYKPSQFFQISYCPICRKKVRRLKSMDDEELDIPIKNHFMQLELGICMECGKRKAKYLCDYITGKSFDLYGKGKIETLTCDKYLCEECTNKLNGKDYCKEHIKELKEELKYIKLGDD